MLLAAWSPLCMGHLGRAGQVVEGHHVAHHEHFGVPW
jgi:hypothetical protein